MIKLWPKVVVLVLNWNGKEDTSECLRSLEHLEYPNYEVIVVDNASTDGSQKFLKENFPEITLIENEQNLGFGGGLNVGIEEARKRGADYVLCLNNDVIADKNVLLELVKVGELSNKIGGLCPMEYFYDEPNRINYAGGKVGLLRDKVYGHGELDKGQFNRIKETWLLCGPAMMLKLKALSDVGLFDTGYFYGPEDKDMALRLIKKGYKIMFVPHAKLWHKRRGVTGGKITPLNIYFSIRNRLLFARKHASKLEFMLFLIYFFIFEFPITLFRILIFYGKDCVHAAAKGVLWHINRKLLFPDDKMVESLTRTVKKLKEEMS